MKRYWVAIRGRCNCGHRHRTEDAAERCLLKWRPPGSRDLGRVKSIDGETKTRPKRPPLPPIRTSGGPGTICIRCRRSMWLLQDGAWICGGCDLQEAGR